MVDFDSPRLRGFRDELAELIPCDPQIRTDLQQMELAELLLRYVNWRDRYVEPRARRVMLWDGFWQHGSPQPHLATVTELAKRIESYDDLKPYLSDRIDRFGYVRATISVGPPAATDTMMRTGFVEYPAFDVCARAASGHAAAPPSVTMNSRRPIWIVM
jgi:hypothetical protein